MARKRSTRIQGPIYIQLGFRDLTQLSWSQSYKKKIQFFSFGMACKPFPKCRFFFLSNQAGKLLMEKYPALSSGKNFKSRTVLFWRGTARGLVSFEHLLTWGTGQDRAGRVSDGKRWTGSYLAKASCRPLRRSSKNPLLNRPKTFLLVGNGGSFLKVTKA